MLTLKITGVVFISLLTLSAMIVSVKGGIKTNDIRKNHLGAECAQLSKTCKNHPYGEISAAAQYCTIFRMFHPSNEKKCKEINKEIKKYRK